MSVLTSIGDGMTDQISGLFGMRATDAKGLKAGVVNEYSAFKNDYFGADIAPTAAPRVGL